MLAMRRNTQEKDNRVRRTQEGPCVFVLDQASKKDGLVQHEAFYAPDNGRFEQMALGPVMPVAYATVTPGYPQGLHFPVQAHRPRPLLNLALYGRKNINDNKSTIYIRYFIPFCGI